MHGREQGRRQDRRPDLALRRPASATAVVYERKRIITEEEVAPYIGAAVRVTLADRGVLAGTLELKGSEHGHAQYSVVSDFVVQGGPKVDAVVHGVTSIVEIGDASDDPAAIE